MASSVRSTGTTANGLVRHSERYRIVSVLDATNAGVDAGTVLGEAPVGIPVHRDLDDALAGAEPMPSCFIIGLAPTSDVLTDPQRDVVLDAR